LVCSSAMVSLQMSTMPSFTLVCHGQAGVSHGSNNCKKGQLYRCSLPEATMTSGTAVVVADTQH